MNTKFVMCAAVLASVFAASANTAAYAAPGDRMKVHAVNATVNAMPSGGKNSKWSLPEYGGGDLPEQEFVWDCEDYVREKAAQLGERGIVSWEVHVRDLKGTAHALLVVEYDDGYREVLDNLTKEPMPVEKAVKKYPLLKVKVLNKKPMFATELAAK